MLDSLFSYILAETNFSHRTLLGTELLITSHSTAFFAMFCSRSGSKNIPQCSSCSSEGFMVLLNLMAYKLENGST